ncbi:MAG: gamma-glutamyltranspeptidase / glutathione hydrolase [Proteiniphilum sp.]|jgi:gamma-glutamyltranspeptidase/glutathione hydrolase|nr:gamma-glutamyltranspeptidase / glutathione hydrolase [Proteiniphilum sp.]
MKYKGLLFLFFLVSAPVFSQRTQKPVLHGKNWMAITGKTLGAEAGAMIFQQGGNAVDAACAMLGATCTLWDVLSWGGETQALIYNPHSKKVIAINALGVAPTGATAEYFKSLGYDFPPEYGPLAAVTPGTVGGLCLMLARYGTMSLEQVLAPSIELASGFPVDIPLAASLARNKERLKEWKYSRELFITHPGEEQETPVAGEIFVQQDLLETLQKLVEAEQKALKAGKNRKEAIMAAYDRFYRGDIAREFVRGSREQGGLITMADLAKWKPVEEEPLHVNYKGIDVYKLQPWTQGPALLQSLNILENFDLKKMGYNSPQYIHTIYQAMNMAFADRDFYYGDPSFHPDIPIKGLLDKAYARQRASEMWSGRNNPSVGPGDPYPFEGKVNPYLHLLKKRGFDITPARERDFVPRHDAVSSLEIDSVYRDRLWRGTTTIQAADAEGWIVSVTPSGGWIPACIAGNTGIGMSQRLQSFVLDEALNPFNVVEPGKRPRVTLTPSLALKNGEPFLSFAVQGGDTQDQNLLQFFLNMVEFGMNVQQASEAANINSNQLWLSLGGTRTEDRAPRPGELLLHSNTPDSVRQKLTDMGYSLHFSDRTSGPINAIYFDREHGTFWGGSSNYGEDYGIGW